MERAELAGGEAEHSRALGKDDPALWATAAETWEELDPPLPAPLRALAPGRGARARRRPRRRGDVASEALRSARELGAEWLVAELESLAARARLRLLGPAEPAGRRGRTGGGRSTSRSGSPRASARCWPWWPAARPTARSACELHMAEKTASVHVSRILAKLDVRSRTEAAAVAVRQGLADTGAAV